ncbi:hypothetical protein NPIL_241871 [Nephila pilipes]|uniref:Uncharacterized protein n=1 Tax=Nephila pilipes TaxID=299642 RepID=A0A8X6NRJ6_NEPPI|nr:hypothetical protein NPIL_241871 [Nephila pilipes]
MTSVQNNRCHQQKSSVPLTSPWQHLGLQLIDRSTVPNEEEYPLANSERVGKEKKIASEAQAKLRSLTENVNSWNQTKNRYRSNPNQAQVLALDHVTLTISFPFAAREEIYPQNLAEPPHRMMQGGKNLNCPPSFFEAKWNVSRTMDSPDAAVGEPQILSSALVMALFFDCWTE